MAIHSLPAGAGVGQQVFEYPISDILGKQGSEGKGRGPKFEI
jgi:hypothetical protein